jgi:hypothetical protein
MGNYSIQTFHVNIETLLSNKTRPVQNGDEWIF